MPVTHVVQQHETLEIDGVSYTAQALRGTIKECEALSAIEERLIAESERASDQKTLALLMYCLTGRREA